MYRLKKSRHIFFHSLKLYRRKKRKLADTICKQIEQQLDLLQQAILKRDRKEADKQARRIDEMSRIHMKRGFFEHAFDVIFSIIFALVVATVVRQMWFELYEIPSGSMRPTLKESDRLFVSKTQFGINVPLMLQHFMFDPKEVKRSGVFIFNGENLNIPKADNYMYYFYLFPGYKQYVKRMMGKPGDILYFYGGQIWGIDKEGNDITNELQPKELGYVSHVPFLSFEGSPKETSRNSFIFYQMDLPVAKLYMTGYRQMKGEMLYAASKESKPVENLSDLWGFKNYAMAAISQKANRYFLELTHSPSLRNSTVLSDQLGKNFPLIGTSNSSIQIDEKMMRAIFSHMTTARFVVKDGFVRRQSQTSPKIEKGVSHHYPPIEGVANGTYEFFDGKGYQVYWQGIRKELSGNHPLMQFDPKRVAFLFNMGMDFDVRAMPGSGFLGRPARYAFFKDGALYLMNGAVLGKEDPLMASYVKRERAKEESSKGAYIPFVDYGPPMKDGKLDIDFIKRAGFKVPDGHYLALGDNYAKSGDSRWFGCVPEANIKGVPEFIFWPPGKDWGYIRQIDYPTFTLSRIIIWTLAFIVFVVWWIWHKKRFSLPIKFDK